MENYDVVIVGAGIIGLSSARAIKNLQPSLRILVCEKESEAGTHASGRNSGVLHAGFYYSPESLKAQFCRDGNLELRNFILQKGIPLLQLGKIVVAKSEDEDRRLINLYQRGLENGVKLEILPRKELPRFEPLAETFNNFLWSPNTAVSSPKLVTRSLVADLDFAGVEIKYSTQIHDAVGGNAEINGKKITYKHLVNAAGSQADRIAHSFGVGEQYSMLPFIGMYKYVKREKLPLRTLVYPVPHPINPFLGVHFTLTYDGLVKIGPTAIPIAGREQYRFSDRITFEDLKSSVSASRSLISGTAHSVRQIIASEFPKYSTRFLIKESSKLIPAARNVNGWRVKPPGIRSQLVNLDSGELVQDFLVEKGLNSTHILNAVSPGWTCALPFGQFVASQVLAEM